MHIRMFFGEFTQEDNFISGWHRDTEAEHCRLNLAVRGWEARGVGGIRQGSDRGRYSGSLVYLPAVLAQVTRLKHGKKRREEKGS